MIPFGVNKSWYEDYWYSGRPDRRQRTVSRDLGRFAVCIMLFAGGVAMLGQMGASDVATHAADVSDPAWAE